jgi:hypothetical protein
MKSARALVSVASVAPVAWLASLTACTASTVVTDGGKVLCANTGECIHAAFYAACYHSGAIVPVQLDGGTLPPQPISAPPPDSGLPPLPAKPSGLLFTDANTLWYLDNANSQIDVLNVGVWPPTVRVTIPTGYGPWQLVACDGMIVSINSTDNTIQGVDPNTYQILGEANVGTGESPYLGACDGQHTFYVTNFGNGDVQAFDLSSTPKFTNLGKYTVPQDAIVQDPDGGVVIAAPQGVTYFPSDAGGGVFFTVASLNTSAGYVPAGRGSVIATDPLLLIQRANIPNDAACENPAFLIPSPNGSDILETCGGNYTIDAGSAEIARIRPDNLSSQGGYSVPIAAPTRMAVLENGLVAVADAASAKVAVFDPTNGSLTAVFEPCPDAGNRVAEFIQDVAAAPAQ